MATLYINTVLMEQKIAELKVEKQKIDEVLARVKGESVKIVDYWSGKAGEAAKERLDEDTNQYDYISSKLAAQIKYLENVVRRYRNENKETIEGFDKNNNTLAI